MSEFECINGHLISSSIGYCEICGGRTVRMDGLSNRELTRLEELEGEGCQEETVSSVE